MIITSIILITLLIYFIFFISQSSNILFKGYAPFISTDKITIREILGKVNIKNDAIIYELGCGRARFLRLAEKAFPGTRLIGIENLASLCLINNIRLRLQGSQIRLLNKDFFTINLKDADVIYCYLNNMTMARLEEKFQQECRQGTLIISRTFSIPGFKPDRVIEIKGKRIFVYSI